MGGVLQIDGDTVYLPSDAATPAPSQPWPLDERVKVSSTQVFAPFVLGSDLPAVLALNGANVIALRVQSNNPTLMRITHANGSQQVVPVDPVAIIVCVAYPITAIDFIRQSGVATEVVVMIGAT